jgi:hypothetical protein
VNQPTVQQSSRVIFVLGAAVLWLAAQPATAANLKDVRIGVHEKYTRIVLETDASAPCEIQSSGEEALVLRLNADSGVREIASKQSAHLTSIEVVPVDVGLSEIRIALRGPVEVKKLVLSAPDRVVLDLSEAQEAGAGAPAAKPSAPPTPHADAVAIREPAAGAPARKPDSLSRAPSEPMPVEPIEPAPEESEAVEPEEAAPALPEPDQSALLGTGEAVEKPVPGAPGSPTLPRPLPVPAPRRAERGLLGALPAPLDQPLVLAGIAAALILVVAFVALRRRGGAAKEEAITPFAAGEPFSVDEKLGAAQEWGAAEGLEGPEAAPPIGLGAAGAEPSLFDQPVGEVEPSGEEPSEGTTADREEEAAPVPPAGKVAPGPGQELERRIAQLEERMEEVIDAKDRLGRQLAAQTEELRVQRAAIARTQRVLRDLTRPDDEPTEPAPKT